MGEKYSSNLKANPQGSFAFTKPETINNPPTKALATKENKCIPFNINKPKSPKPKVTKPTNLKVVALSPELTLKP